MDLTVIRRLHETLVQAAGPTAALAIEIGGAVFLAALIALALRAIFSPGARRQRSIEARFAELGRANGLVRRDRRLLREMARQLGMEEPGLLFVRRSLFDQAAQRVAAEPAAVEDLRARLFTSGAES